MRRKILPLLFCVIAGCASVQERPSDELMVDPVDALVREAVKSGGEVSGTVNGVDITAVYGHGRAGCEKVTVMEKDILEGEMRRYFSVCGGTITEEMPGEVFYPHDDATGQAVYEETLERAFSEGETINNYFGKDFVWTVKAGIVEDSYLKDGCRVIEARTFQDGYFVDKTKRRICRPWEGMPAENQIR